MSWQWKCGRIGTCVQTNGIPEGHILARMPVAKRSLETASPLPVSTCEGSTIGSCRILECLAGTFSRTQCSCPAVSKLGINRTVEFTFCTTRQIKPELHSALSQVLGLLVPVSPFSPHAWPALDSRNSQCGPQTN